jgi:hypothetical protein
LYCKYCLMFGLSSRRYISNAKSQIIPQDPQG